MNTIKNKTDVNKLTAYLPKKQTTERKMNSK